MNTKKICKIVSAILIILMLATIATNVLATDPADIKGTTSGAGATSVTNIGNQILGIIQVVGTITAVIVLVVLGIKYMIGSAEEKAEYKKTMIPYIIGAVLIFAASNLASMIYKWANEIKA